MCQYYLVLQLAIVTVAGFDGGTGFFFAIRAAPFTCYRCQITSTEKNIKPKTNLLLQSHYKVFGVHFMCRILDHGVCYKLISIDQTTEHISSARPLCRAWATAKYTRHTIAHIHEANDVQFTQRQNVSSCEFMQWPWNDMRLLRVCVTFFSLPANVP